MTMVLWVLSGILAFFGVALLAGFLFTRQVAAKVRKGFPPIGKSQPVTGGEIHYVEKGEGSPILLIHGLSGSLHNFTYSMLDPLAEHHRVIAIDRPGCGHSSRDADESARLPEQARMVAEFIDTLGLERPLVVGHSLGGAVGLALALDYPEKVGGLALIAPLTAVQSEVPSVFNGIRAPVPVLRRLLAETLAVPGTIRNGARVVSAIFAPDPVPADFRERGGGLLALRPEAFYAASTDMHAVPLDIEAMVARYGELQLPMGVLYGDRDGVLQHDLHIQALTQPHPELYVEILEGVGHMPPVSHADESVAFVRSMIARSGLD